MSLLKNTRTRFLFAYILVALLGIGAGHFGTNQPTWILLVMIAVAILAAIFGANNSAQTINGLISKIVAAADQLAEGTVDIDMAAGVNYEERELNRSFGRVIKAIKELVSDAEIVTSAMAEGKLSTRAEVSKHAGKYKIIVEGLNSSLDAVIGPLNVAAEYVDRISKGDIPEKISDSFNGDFNTIKNNLNTCIDEVNGLIGNANMLARAAVEGRLDTRADASKNNGAFRVIAEGVNVALDAVTGLLNVAAEYVDRISKGDIPTKITDNYNGDFNEIKNSINACIDGLGGLAEGSKVVARLATNDFTKKVEGQYQGIFAETAEGINTVRERLRGVVDINMSIANGDYAKYLETFQKVGKRCEEDTLMPSYRMSMENIDRLVKEANMMAEAAVAGRLDARIEVAQHPGEYRNVVEGINNTMDALVGPLNMAAEYVERIGKGDIPAKITDSYNGDFNEIKNSINACIDGLGGLVEGSKVIERLATNDFTRKVEGQYQGIFAETAEGINTVGDRLRGVVDINMSIANGDYAKYLETFQKVGKRCEEDTLMPSYRISMENIDRLVKDANMMAETAIAGKLDARIEVAQHPGEYRNVVEGINNTMDALIAPVSEAIQVVNEMAKGSLSVKMTGNYKGDNAQLKEHLNSTIDGLAGMIGDVSATLGQIANGNLDLNIDEDLPGDFINISSALKQIVASLNEIMGDINNAAEEVAGGAGQLSDSSQAMAQGASEQASAIEQLTAAITEIAAQTKQNAASANQANELSLTARDNASQGDEQMKEMLGAMEGINDSSVNISKIIKVIDEIAFQTNILALNAAVEAARAGQHGKGFAVVAEEVRNLAARSASAAKETTDLIEGSIRKVQSGTKIANETAQALKKIVDGVSQAAALVGDIAVASNEQATGIAQVDQGIVQVSQVVQSNSAIAQQSAGASEELSEQAKLLKRNVAKMRLKEKYINSPISNPRESAPGKRRLEAVASGSGKAKISLDDGGFGKY